MAMNKLYSLENHDLLSSSSKAAKRKGGEVAELRIMHPTSLLARIVMPVLIQRRQHAVYLRLDQSLLWGTAGSRSSSALPSFFLAWEQSLVHRC